MKYLIDPEPHADLPEGLWTYGVTLFAKVWNAYREAGYPFGETNEGMLAWYTFDQQTRTN